VIRGANGYAGLASQRGRVDEGVLVVQAVIAVKYQAAVPGKVLVFGNGGLQVLLDRRAIVANEHVDMCRHVVRVFRVGDELPDHVGCS
jgi:hypothetical protein